MLEKVTTFLLSLIDHVDTVVDRLGGYASAVACASVMLGLLSLFICAWLR